MTRNAAEAARAYQRALAFAARPACRRFQSRRHLRPAGQRRRGDRCVLERAARATGACRRATRRWPRRCWPPGASMRGSPISSASSDIARPRWRSPRTRSRCARTAPTSPRLEPLPRRPARTSGSPRASRPKSLDALQQLLYLLHFFDVEPELIGRYRAHARRAGAAASTASRGRGRRERRPGKLAHRLPVGRLPQSRDGQDDVGGDRGITTATRFDVFGYSTSDVRDEWTERYESLFDGFDAARLR